MGGADACGKQRCQRASNNAPLAVIRALDMAAWDAAGDLAGLVHHADHYASQYTTGWRGTLGMRA